MDEQLEMQVIEASNKIIDLLRAIGLDPDTATQVLVSIAAGMCAECPSMAEVNKERFALHFSKCIDAYIEENKHG